MQVEVEMAKHSLYKAQQELLAKVQAADARERERAAELAAEAASRRAREAAQRAQQAQEAARLEARRREIEQNARQASGPSAIPCLLWTQAGHRRSDSCQHCSACATEYHYILLGLRHGTKQYPDKVCTFRLLW